MSRRTRENKGKRRLEEKKAQSDMTKFYWVLGAVAVIGIAAVGWSVGSQALSSAVAQPVDLGELANEELVQMARGVEMGQPDAPVTIVEFADYQCPGCREFFARVKPMVELELVQSGKAKFVFYDFPLTAIHSNAFIAARAARCAEDQGRFWEYHNKLFTEQSRWASEGTPTGMFDDYAAELGLDTAAFSSCLNSDRHADLITAQMQLAEALGLPGTPSILVSRGEGMATRVGSYDFASIQAAVEAVSEGG